MKRFLILLAVLTLILSCVFLDRLWFFHPSTPDLSGDTPFEQAARAAMPEPSEFADALSVSRIHKERLCEEFAALKVTYPPERFPEKVSGLSGPFYSVDMILGAPFCACENPYSVGDYTFRVVELPEYAEDPMYPYGLAVGIQESECSILYLFVASDDFQYMGLDGITRTIWDAMEEIL